MEEAPLITIITVTYNAGDVIDKTLDSLKEQSYKDFEFLVIDGASKDDTVKRVEAASLPSTKILSEPDKGLYDAMNKGIGLANGKYIIFLNAGDSFHTPNTLRQYSIEADKGADIIYGDTIIVDDKGKKISDRHLSAPDKLTKASFSKGMLICHQAFMVKKEKAPLYDLNYRFSADYDWCVKCISASKAGKNVNLGCVTIDYLSNGLTDHNKKESLKERMRIMAKHYGWPLTILRHISFIFRSIRRGSI